MPLHKVTCMPRGHALGLTQQLPEDDRHSVSYTEYLAEIDVCMGGRVAEELSRCSRSMVDDYILTYLAHSLWQRECFQWRKFRHSARKWRGSGDGEGTSTIPGHKNSVAHTFDSGGATLIKLDLSSTTTTTLQCSALRRRTRLSLRFGGMLNGCALHHINC